jgi:glutamyl-tRNA reductase
MLISLGIDHLHADVATRERFHIPEERVGALYDAAPDGVIDGVALVATCNRTELYGWTPADDEVSVQRAVHGLAHRWTLREREREPLLTVARRRTGDEVARHLLRVAAGLESQVLGDGQILGQIRTAYRQASTQGLRGSVMHRLFETALRAGRRVQAETALSAGRNSIGAEAASLVARRFGSLDHVRAVVVGCGKTGERVARQLVKLGLRDLVLVNRSQTRAQELAGALDARVAPLEHVHVEVAMADVALVATAATMPILDAEALERARAGCDSARWPLLLIDLAMPRNVDPHAARLTNVTALDLDSLHPPIVAAEAARRHAAPAAVTIVETELRDFRRWLAERSAREAVRPLREALESICQREVAYVVGEDAARQVASRIVAKALARPMMSLRAALERGEQVGDIGRALEQLFEAQSDRLAGGPTPSILPAPAEPEP